MDTREQLIRCGIELCTEQGFQATAIEEVLKKVGVPKGSFYHYFASKEKFGLALIDGYSAYFVRRLDSYLLDMDHRPLDRLANFVASVRISMARYQFTRGCLVGNLGQELAALNDAFRTRLEATFKDWEMRLAVCLEEGKSNGEIPAHVDTAGMAALFWTGWEGAILRAKLVKNTAPLDLFAHYFFECLAR